MTSPVVRRPVADGRWDVPSAEALKRLTTAPVPLGLRATEAARSFLRDVYYDTPDLALRAKRVACVVRHRSDDRQELVISVVEERGGPSLVTRLATEVPRGDVRGAMDGSSEAARLLRSIVNPATLGAQLELEIDRYTRVASASWWRRASFELQFDIVTVRAAGLSRSFHELSLRELRQGRPSVDQLSRALSEAFGLRGLTFERHERGEQLRAALESEALARGVGRGRWVAVAALDGPAVATLVDGSQWRLPVAEGSGEDACRHLLRRTLGSTVGDLRLITTTQGEGRLRALEVWVCTHVDRSAQPADGATLVWSPIEDLLAAVGTPKITDTASLAALAMLSQSEVLPRLLTLPTADALEARTAERKLKGPTQTYSVLSGEGPLLDGEESLVAFSGRVLALAEDLTVPLLERLRYVAIVASNMDEFFSVRMGGLKFSGRDVIDESDGTGETETRLQRVRHQSRALVARQHESATASLRELASHGIRVRGPTEWSDADREYLRTYFRSTVLPYLTPRAITATPGHSLPIVADRALCYAVGLRAAGSTGPLHLAELTVPSALARFVPLPGDKDFAPLEDVIRQALPLVYPGRHVAYAYLFRLTRYADLGVDESQAGNLVQSVEERTSARRHQPVVRIEVERSMPPDVRDQLIRELQLEPGARPGGLSEADVFEVPGLMDLDALRQLADLPLPGLSYTPFSPRRPLASVTSLWDVIRERDVLLHHPYEDFGTSVVRFFEEAADDPDVAAIKVALYRAGERSPIVDALRRAATNGKSVSVFVELKARFDEQRNVRWTKQLEAAGVHVVNGLPGYKNHSKIAMVVRSEPDGPRRYAHVGTGNYNAGTARVYTDLGVLTARQAICDDLTDLFNTLTGSSAPADVAYRECLVAPNTLLPGLLERIDREAEHARAGRGGRIRMKINGLSDREVVRALYGAAQAGVEIDLVVRGICTLWPGLPGVSDRIRVVSLLGRFLEHARIYVFSNAGAPEYFIGSADLRPRNLRRRVELLVPIHSPDDRERLDAILDAELNDPTAWNLNANGAYARRVGTLEGGAVSAQTRFAIEAQGGGGVT
ncbi:MAG: polyphosphate kinase 1 [Gemmatimonadaceae bacterium]